MVAALLEGTDGGQDHGLLPVEDVADLFGGQEVAVDVLLDLGQRAAHDLECAESPQQVTSDSRPAPQSLAGGNQGGQRGDDYLY